MQKKEEVSQNLNNDQAFEYAKAILLGTWATAMDYVNMVAHPIDDVIYPMSILAHDAAIITSYYNILSPTPGPIDVAFRTLQQVVAHNPQLYHDAAARMQQRVDSLKLKWNEFENASGPKKVEIATHAITSVLAPGYIVKSVKVAANLHRFGVANPPKFHNTDPDLSKTLPPFKKFLLSDIRSEQGSKSYIYVIPQAQELSITSRNLVLAQGKYPEPILHNGQLMTHIHHPHLANLQPIYAAGEIYVENGVIKKINNFSGHYLPEGAHLEKIARNSFLRSGFKEAKTCEFSDVTKELFVHPEVKSAIITREKIGFGPSLLPALPSSILQLASNSQTSDPNYQEKEEIHLSKQESEQNLNSIENIGNTPDTNINTHIMTDEQISEIKSENEDFDMDEFIDEVKQLDLSDLRESAASWSVEECIEIAEQLMLQDEFAFAIPIFESALIKDINNANIYGQLAACYYDAGDLEKALHYINTAIHFNSNDYMHFYIRASINLKMGDLQAALKDNKHSIELYKPDYFIEGYDQETSIKSKMWDVELNAKTEVTKQATVKKTIKIRGLEFRTAKAEQKKAYYQSEKGQQELAAKQAKREKKWAKRAAYASSSTYNIFDHIHKSQQQMQERAKSIDMKSLKPTSYTDSVNLQTSMSKSRKALENTSEAIDRSASKGGELGHQILTDHLKRQSNSTSHATSKSNFFPSTQQAVKNSMKHEEIRSEIAREKQAEKSGKIEGKADQGIDVSKKWPGCFTRPSSVAAISDGKRTIHYYDVICPTDSGEQKVSEGYTISQKPL